MESIFVSTVAWVSKGFARRIPKQLEFTEDQIEEMRQDPLVRKHLNKDIDKLDQIDIEQMEEDPLPVFTQQFANMRNEQEQPAQDKYPQAVEDLEDEEREDYYIKETDALLVAGKVDKQYSSLEIYVYEQELNNLYVHHEIMLSAFPLDIEWLNVELGQVGSEVAGRGNYAIVSTFLTEIQIWDVDLADAIEPTLILGGQMDAPQNKPKKFKNKNKKYKAGSHTDSVLSISLNKFHKNILASGSSDMTCKIWDLQKGQSIYTISHHKDRVSKVEWSPKEQTILCSGSFDKTIEILDSRYPEDKIVQKVQSLESLCWNPNNPTQVAYTTEEGNFCLFDGKMPGKPIFDVRVHAQAATGCRIGQKNMGVTCSEDGIVKVWDIFDLDEGKPRLIHAQNPKCGKLFCIQMYQQSEVICCGNGHGELFVWDSYENKHIQEHFSRYK